MVEIIAEIGQAHDGSLGILHSYIDALSTAGVTCIKFQMHIAEAESSAAEPFRVPFSFEDDTRFDYWKRMSFTKDQWIGIKSHCDKNGVEFMVSPFSCAAVDLLEEIGVQRYKIGSGEVSNLLMLEKIARTKKPIILSSGMSSYMELDATVALLKSFGNDISILQCTTSYPTEAERIGFNVISEMKLRYSDCKIGLSEHTARPATSIAAVTMGAEILEFHAVFDRKLFGPDATSSMTIIEIEQLVKDVRFIELALSNPIEKDDLSPYTELKSVFEKSIAINKVVSKGYRISFDDLESKKPANQGISASDYKKVIGQTVNKDLGQWDFLQWSDLQDN